MQARLTWYRMLACLASMALGNAPCLDSQGSRLRYAANVNYEGKIPINCDMLISFVRNATKLSRGDVMSCI